MNPAIDRTRASGTRNALKDSLPEPGHFSVRNCFFKAFSEKTLFLSPSKKHTDFFLTLLQSVSK